MELLLLRQSEYDEVMQRQSEDKERKSAAKARQTEVFWFWQTLTRSRDRERQREREKESVAFGNVYHCHWPNMIHVRLGLGVCADVWGVPCILRIVECCFLLLYYKIFLCVVSVPASAAGLTTYWIGNENHETMKPDRSDIHLFSSLYPLCST